MGLLYVQRLGDFITFASTATQYIINGGTLAFSVLTIIELDPTVFTQAGYYLLFDYSGGSFPGGQADFDRLTLDFSDTGFTYGELKWLPDRKAIIVGLS